VPDLQRMKPGGAQFAAWPEQVTFLLERHCLTRLDPEALNRLLGQRSDDLVNIAAISAGRFQNQIGCVRQDSPKGPPANTNGPLTSR
jgi:hypothetical protein